MAQYSDLERDILEKSLERLKGAVPSDLLDSWELAIKRTETTLTAKDVRRLIRQSVLKDADADS